MRLKKNLPTTTDFQTTRRFISLNSKTRAVRNIKVPRIKMHLKPYVSQQFLPINIIKVVTFLFKDSKNRLSK